MKNIILLIVILLIFVSNLFAGQDNWSQKLYESVHFAENGNDVIVDLDQLKKALANGANPNWINSEHKRKISILGNYVWLISLSDNPEVVQQGIKAINILFDNKAKLQYCDGSILFWPIAYGKYDIVKLLLDHGSNATFWPKDEIDSDTTPIEEATANGYEKIIDLLVSYGASKLSQKDAVQIRFIEAARFEKIDVLQDLVKKGATVNGTNRNHQTALLNALGGGRYDYDLYIKVMYLLDLGADVNLKGEGIRILGSTFPLHMAVWWSSVIFNGKGDTSYAKQILNELIKRGAYISAPDDEGKTPLHIAADRNNLYAAKLLIDSGSKIMPKDKSGKTPLDYAKSAKMIKLLKDHGAKEL